MADPLYAFVGDAMRRHRTAIGMTQAALAERLSLSRTSVTNIEMGRQPLLVHQLVGAAVALGTSVMELLPPEPNEETAIGPTSFDALVGSLRTPYRGGE